MKVEENKPRF